MTATAVPDFAKRLDQTAEDTEALLARLLADAALPDEIVRPKRLMDAMRYSSLGGGKRLRPFLVVESSAVFGVAREAALLVRDWAWNQLGLPRLVSIIQLGNDRSVRLAERLSGQIEREITTSFGKRRTLRLRATGRLSGYSRRFLRFTSRMRGRRRTELGRR